MTMLREDTQFETVDTAEGAGGGGNLEISYAGLSNVKHGIKGVSWSYASTPTGGGIDIYDGAVSGGNLVWQILISAAGPGFVHFPGCRWGSEGRALNIVLLDGGGSVSGQTLNVDGHLER